MNTLLSLLSFAVAVGALAASVNANRIARAATATDAERNAREALREARDASKHHSEALAAEQADARQVSAWIGRRADDPWVVIVEVGCNSPIFDVTVELEGVNYGRPIPFQHDLAAGTHQFTPIRKSAKIDAKGPAWQFPVRLTPDELPQRVTRTSGATVTRLDFTDSAGVKWTRDATGILTKATSRRRRGD